MRLFRMLVVVALSVTVLGMEPASADWKKVLSCTRDGASGEGLVVDYAIYVRGVAGYQIVVRDPVLVQAVQEEGAKDPCFASFLQPNEKGEIIVTADKVSDRGETPAAYGAPACGRGRGIYVASDNGGSDYRLVLRIQGERHIPLTCVEIGY